MPHEDGNAYAPVVATVSLGASLVLDIYEREMERERGEQKKNDNDLASKGSSSSTTTATATFSSSSASSSSSDGPRRPKYRIFQEPRSLLITTGGMYTDYLHGIAEVEVDEDIVPYSSTIRKGIVNWDLLQDKEAISDGRNVRSTRVSLTYRDVLKVKELGKSLRFLSGQGGR